MAILLPALIVAATLSSGPSGDVLADVRLPRTVKVLPIFFVPKGGPQPTADQADKLMRHLEWTRTRYRELLPGHVTFGVAAKHPLVFQAKEKIEYYRPRPDLGAPDMVGELLPYLHFTRFNCPYVMLVMVMNPVDDYPGGLGQPLNGGYNTGGSILILPSSGLDKFPNLQSTMQHELGHAFGLPHVDVYGYDMRTNDSLMSYNPKHHTNGFKPSPTLGRFIPEDVRELALNQRVFPGLRFDPARDIPKGYRIARLMGLGPMIIPGQPEIVKIATESGELDGSKAAAILIGPLTAIEKGVKPAFDPETMWKSGKSPTGWVSLQITLPVEVPLTRFVIHTMPLGEPDAAQAVRISVQEAGGAFRKVMEKEIKGMDDVVGFKKTSGRVWRFEFRGAPDASLVVRGIEFFSGRERLFPPLIPF